MKIDFFKKSDDTRGKGQRPFRKWIRLRLMKHVTACPKCQKRLALTNRVEIALCLIKSQPQNMDLLAKANTSALRILKHSLRYSRKSESLRRERTRLRGLNRISPVFEQILNIAACVFVLLMIRCGIFNSLTNYKEEGQAVLQNYYARNLDQELIDEIFPAGSQNNDMA